MQRVSFYYEAGQRARELPRVSPLFASLEGIHQLFPGQEPAMTRDYLIHFPSCSNDGVVKILCLRANHWGAGLTMKNGKHVALEKDSLAG